MQSEDPAPTERPISAQPTSLGDLFWSFNWMALQGFGGVLAVAQRVLCEQKKWLTPREFSEDWAVAQVLPGPNVVNLALMLGDRFFGLRGALAATTGLFLVPILLVLVLGTLYSHFAAVPAVTAAVKGMGAVSAGLIAATGLKLFATIKTSPTGKIAFALAAITTFVMVAILRQPLISAIVLVGLPSIFWTYWRLVQQSKQP
jgi:chromate transporter